MGKTEETATAFSDQMRETLTPADISAMLEEAAAVDALFERMRRGPLHFASVVSTYLSSPDKDAKPDPAS